VIGPSISTKGMIVAEVLMSSSKSSRNISDSESNVSDDLSPESLSLRVIKLENALCN
jgi:hypothetical protein